MKKFSFTLKIVTVILSICMVFGTMPGVFAANPIVTVGTATGKPGETVSIPVTLTDNSVIAGYQLSITYDPSKVIAKNVVFNPNQRQGGSSQNLNTAAEGYIRIAYAASEPLFEGLIFTVSFEIKEGAPGGEVAVEMTGERFDDVNADKVPVTVIQGKIIVEADNAELEAAKAAFKAVTAEVPQALQEAQQALDKVTLDVPEVAAARTAVQNAIAAVQAANKTDAEIDAMSSIEEVNAAKAALEAALDDLRAKVAGLYEAQIKGGDLNQDGKISVGDLAIAAYHYGKDSNSPDWDVVSKYDLNKDARIGIEDLVFVAIRILG
ncbi:MAG: hypothetical protein GX066_10465 [Clostridiaceae bacterium]|nr:hypothetical protein [Clostridiaceae bacterium]